MEGVSVIIPAYNCANWLIECVESCLRQQHLLEVIIVDDFSTDNTFTIAEHLFDLYPDKIKLLKNDLKGGNNARNYGFKYAQGEFVQWLDADDIILPGKFEHQVNHLRSGTADIVYSSGVLNTYGPKGDLILKEGLETRVYEDYLLELLKDNWLPPHSYLLKRVIAEKLYLSNAWNPKTIIAQDREYFTRAAILGAKFAFLHGNFFVYNRRISERTVSRKLSMNDKARILVAMLNNFKKELHHSTRFTGNSKKKYWKLINTQIIYYSVIYKIASDIDKYSVFDIQWNLIKGFRSKMKVMINTLFGYA